MQHVGPSHYSDMAHQHLANLSHTGAHRPSVTQSPIVAQKPVVTQNPAVTQRLTAASNSEPSQSTARLTVEPRLVADPNRVLSNTRHLNPQVANPATASSTSAPLTSNPGGPSTAPTVAQVPAPPNFAMAPNGTVFSSTTGAPAAYGTDNAHPALSDQPSRHVIHKATYHGPQLPSVEPSMFTTPLQSPSPTLSNGQIQEGSQQLLHTPTTLHLANGSSLRTPASADKRHLARDILRSLAGKRKRSQDALIDISSKRVRDEVPANPAQPSSVTSDASAIENSQRREEEAQVQSVENMITTLLLKSASPPLLTAQTTDMLPSEPVDAGSKALALPTTAVLDTQLVAGPSKAREPLFLPSPTSSLRSSVQFDPGDLGAAYESPPIPIPSPSVSPPLYKKQMEPYVLILPPPDWVKRHIDTQRTRNKSGQRLRDAVQQRPAPARKVLQPSDLEDDIEEIEQWDGEANTGSRGREMDADGTSFLTRRRALNLMRVSYT